MKKNLTRKNNYIGFTRVKKEIASLISQFYYIISSKIELTAHIVNNQSCKRCQKQSIASKSPVTYGVKCQQPLEATMLVRSLLR